MALNVEKNKDSLIKAWKDVVDDKTKTNWAVFGYEAQSFILQLVDTGDRGLEEMADSLNSGKIMYAFCRVIDPKTSLPKYVLINWQGDGAPVDKKGKCANHIRDVANLFKGAHVTFNARNEDEVDADDILEKVSSATASHFSFTQRDGPLQSHKPVSSVYKRTYAAAEINPSERDKFWEQEEISEKQRVAEEKKKSDEGKKRLEQERKDREMKEAIHREDHIVEKAKRLSMQLESNGRETSKIQEEKKKWERQLEEDKEAEDLRKKRSQVLREERRNEAQTLIAQRTFNARAVFEQNTWKGQMSNPSSPRTPNVIDPAPDDKNNRFDFNNGHTTEAVTNSKPENNFTPTSPVQQQQQQPQQQQPIVTNNVESKISNEEIPVVPQQNGAAAAAVEQEIDTNGYDDAYNAALTAQGLRARALYDYQAADDTELSFDPDDIITNIEQVDEGWWQGMAPDGTYGLFPANYVELLDD